MRGTVWLGCGSALDEEPLWRSILDRPRTRILYWPFALPREMLPSADGWLRGNLDRLGVDYELVTWQGLAQHAPSELCPGSTDLLFVGGGNTFRLLDEVRSHGFTRPIREFWRDGGDYYGGSAGAVLACESIAIAEGNDANEPGLSDLTGLALIAGVAVLPHFTDAQHASASHWSSTHDTTVIGLPETMGVRCSAGIATALGAGTVRRFAGDVVDEFAPGDSFQVSDRSWDDPPT
ncbi:Type 1 glutamine amidotransferase-like domain-containing protein [Occultella kanbiaonis]|uniref:Type 1 glutamine amidotransferase-like domain-containing protein n=1 Tax=Occultella kanbiaonis TaxID=2675754 RepID=UPI00143DEB6B|nr:Type 1 glutamine amidotransferase-like domain-containing protein [Occultella kanbiaonis]